MVDRIIDRISGTADQADDIDSLFSLCIQTEMPLLVSVAWIYASKFLGLAVQKERDNLRDCGRGHNDQP